MLQLSNNPPFSSMSAKRTSVSLMYLDPTGYKNTSLQPTNFVSLPWMLWRFDMQLCTLLRYQSQEHPEALQGPVDEVRTWADKDLRYEGEQTNSKITCFSLENPGKHKDFSNKKEWKIVAGAKPNKVPFLFFRGKIKFCFEEGQIHDGIIQISEGS
jgi:hypothetical protein